MVHLVRLISAAALASVSSAAPMVRRGSAIGIEAAPVSAPNGIPITETDLLPSSTEASIAAATAADYGNSWGDSSSSDSYQAPPSSEDSSSWDSSSSVDEWASSVATAWNSVETIASETSSAWNSVATYGSGSSSWGSGYNDCVQQCAASYSQPAFTWTPSATQGSDSGSYSGNSGSNGVTHTIVVAPSQGVLRYIPFSTNASVGDTISFQWGAGPHTVTQSSALEVCNHTDLNGGGFASGPQNKSFVFNQVVNDTKPIWFYCGIPSHCQKGMFGGINIGQPDPTGSDSTIVSGNDTSSSSYTPLSSVMSNLTDADQSMQALWGYTKSQTGDNTYANSWGMNVDCSGMSQDAMMQTAENVMYMQTLIAKNPQAIQDGKFSVTDVNSLHIPMDLPQALAASQAAGGNGSAAVGGDAPGSGSATNAAPPSATSKKSGAASIASSSVAVGLIAVAATFLAL
jgi:plastocyanin